MRWLRRVLWAFILAAGAAELAMTVSDVGLEGVDTSSVLAVLVGWAFAGSGLYAWKRRPESALGPLMLLVGCVYLAAQILVQAQASLLFTSGVWLGDAWVVLFVVFLLSFPDGRLNVSTESAAGNRARGLGSRTRRKAPAPCKAPSAWRG